MTNQTHELRQLRFAVDALRSEIAALRMTRTPDEAANGLQHAQIHQRDVDNAVE
jgi:hypothetical protein